MRSVFLGTSAFVGRIDGAARCAFWAEEPCDHGFDAARLISVDLSRTPKAAAERKLSWDAVQVDDCVVGPGGDLAGTTIGTRWPEMQLSGVVYLEEGYWKSLPPSLQRSWPPRDAGGREYELMRVVYWPHIDDPRAGRRYSGVHAEIVLERGSLALVAINPPKLSQDPVESRPSTMWIDFSSAVQCDAGPGSLTRIGVGSAPKAGALFLRAGDLL